MDSYQLMPLSIDSCQYLGCKKNLSKEIEKAATSCSRVRGSIEYFYDESIMPSPHPSRLTQQLLETRKALLFINTLATNLPAISCHPLASYIRREASLTINMIDILLDRYLIG